MTHSSSHRHQYRTSQAALRSECRPAYERPYSLEEESYMYYGDSDVNPEGILAGWEQYKSISNTSSRRKDAIKRYNNNYGSYLSDDSGDDSEMFLLRERPLAQLGPRKVSRVRKGSRESFPFPRVGTSSRFTDREEIHKAFDDEKSGLYEYPFEYCSKKDIRKIHPDSGLFGSTSGRSAGMSNHRNEARLKVDRSRRGDTAGSSCRLDEISLSAFPDRYLSLGRPDPGIDNDNNGRLFPGRKTKSKDSLRRGEERPSYYETDRRFLNMPLPSPKPDQERETYRKDSEDKFFQDRISKTPPDDPFRFSSLPCPKPSSRASASMVDLETELSEWDLYTSPRGPIFLEESDPEDYDSCDFETVRGIADDKKSNSSEKEERNAIRIFEAELKRLRALRNKVEVSSLEERKSTLQQVLNLHEGLEMAKSILELVLDLQKWFSEEGLYESSLPSTKHCLNCCKVQTPAAKFDIEERNQNTVPWKSVESDDHLPAVTGILGDRMIKTDIPDLVDYHDEKSTPNKEPSMLWPTFERLEVSRNKSMKNTILSDVGITGDFLEYCKNDPVLGEVFSMNEWISGTDSIPLYVLNKSWEKAQETMRQHTEDENKVWKWKNKVTMVVLCVAFVFCMVSFFCIGRLSTHC